MMALSDGRKSFPIGLAVLIQYRSVTDTQPPSQPASHVAVAITLNAQASSLKIMFSLLYVKMYTGLYTDLNSRDLILGFETPRVIFYRAAVVSAVY